MSDDAILEALERQRQALCEIKEVLVDIADTLRRIETRERPAAAAQRCRDGFHVAASSEYRHRRCTRCGYEWEFWPAVREQPASPGREER